MTCEKCAAIRKKYRNLMIRLLDESRWRKFSEEMPKPFQKILIYTPDKKIKEGFYFVSNDDESMITIYNDYHYHLDQLTYWRPNIKPPKEEKQK